MEKEVKEIYFGDEITEKSINDLIDECKGHNKITLFLNSQGGSPAPAIAFYNFIKTNKIKLTVNVVSDCASSAIILLLAGSKRKSAKNVFFLLHMLKRNLEGRYTVAMIKAELEDFKLSEKRLQEIVAKELKLKLKDLLPIFEAEKAMSAKNAHGLGLLTEKPY